MSPDQFEALIVSLCREMLGIGVKGFTKGPDGGCDAKFIGTAECYPSKAAPWKGTMIIQAKHTNGYNCSCSDTDFYSEKSKHTVIAKEIPRIKKLRADQQLDYYMLFTNRRLSGIAEKDITTYISKQCDIPVASICLCGVDELERHLNDFPEAADKEKMHLYLMDAPLTVNSDLLAEIVEALARFKKDGGEVLLRDASPTMRVAYERKNTLNKMTEEYAKEWRNSFLKDTTQIRDFLAAPENRELMQKYQCVIDDFKFNIIAKRKDYDTLEVKDAASD
ncbi:restriction endonuclease [Xylella taiwanensis]|nr:ABC-three component system protein [Xylella taiwanensis]MCD8455592.1 restriction endonuclease [Xylella taiwanensis]MCD8457999.1 restriction endonuclease [Xylella taiwanensis]MCD8460134.1 restriction endonuclease [Xylella taiwanensis]MCD8463807.1 restriction endonuclease [Xylella taiwanensis]MCD8464637.1 restriction endonuclease [Xylella taiwanensis]